MPTTKSQAPRFLPGERRLLRIALVAIASAALAPASSAEDLEHPLFRAIRRGDNALLASLLRQGAPTGVRRADGTTPLVLAALRGDAESVRLLLAHGADPGAANAAGATALLWGAGDAEKVRLLLDHGADPHARSALGNTALLAAAAHWDGAETVKLLLDRGADPGARDNNGLSALERAVDSGSIETARLIIERGSKDVRANAKNSLCLRLAASQGDVEMVELLLDHGADPNASDGEYSGHALNYALLAEEPGVVEVLVRRGCDLTLPTPIGKVPPAVLAAYTEVGDLTAARLLAERGIDFRAANEREETAMEWARRRGHRDLVELLGKVCPDHVVKEAETRKIPDRNVSIHAGNRAGRFKEAIRRSLDLLLASSDTFLKNRDTCVSCHHQNLPGVAVAWARDRGFRIDQGSLRRMMERQVADWSRRIDAMYQMDRHVPVPPEFLGYGLFGFGEIGRRADEVTDAAVWYLAALQRPDGHWRTNERVQRPPLGSGDIHSTVLAMRSLQLYPLEGHEREFAERVERTRRWLLEARPLTHQERVFQLLGLGWSGASRDDLAPLTAEILSAQRDDGGWAQLPGLASDAFATGETLVALAIAGGIGTSHPVYERGLIFLLRTQFDDGSWYVRSRAWPFQPHFDSGFPHGRDQWISAAATAWATMALTLAVEPFVEVAAAAGETPGKSPPATPGAGQAVDPPGPQAAAIDFARDVKPILERSCTACHGTDKPRASFRVTSREALTKGGDSGIAAVVPGKSAESPLLRFVAGQVEDMEMPPLAKRGEYPALSPEEIARLRAWIDQGASWPQGVVLASP
jgi:ankyrin repeat protein